MDKGSGEGRRLIIISACLIIGINLIFAILGGWFLVENEGRDAERSIAFAIMGIGALTCVGCGIKMIRRPEDCRELWKKCLVGAAMVLILGNAGLVSHYGSGSSSSLGGFVWLIGLIFNFFAVLIRSAVMILINLCYLGVMFTARTILRDKQAVKEFLGEDTGRPGGSTGT